MKIIEIQKLEKFISDWNNEDSEIENEETLQMKDVYEDIFEYFGEYISEDGEIDFEEIYEEIEKGGWGIEGIENLENESEINEYVGNLVKEYYKVLDNISDFCGFDLELIFVSFVMRVSNYLKIGNEKSLYLFMKIENEVMENDEIEELDCDFVIGSLGIE